MDVSWNGGTPKTPPKWSFLVGKPMVVGYHHFRKPPYLPSEVKMRGELTWNWHPVVGLWNWPAACWQGGFHPHNQMIWSMTWCLQHVSSSKHPRPGEFHHDTHHISPTNLPNSQKTKNSCDPSTIHHLPSRIPSHPSLVSINSPAFTGRVSPQHWLKHPQCLLPLRQHQRLPLSLPHPRPHGWAAQLLVQGPVPPMLRLTTCLPPNPPSRRVGWGSQKVFFLGSNGFMVRWWSWKVSGCHVSYPHLVLWIEWK